MPSTRIALVVMGLGSALLGWSVAGVSAVADDLPAQSAPPALHQPDHRHDHRGGL